MTTSITFLRLLKATQAERDAAPCVPAVIGILALRRDGIAVLCPADVHPTTLETGQSRFMNADVIATLDLDATLERLEELERLQKRKDDGI